VWRGPRSEVNLRAGRPRSAITARFLALAGVVTAAVAISATPAMALSSSHTVALIPSSQPSPAEGIPPARADGILPTTTTVAGNPNESFGKFAFTDVALTQINPAELAKFDTVVLNEVKTRSLSPAAKAALAQFVANGGKLLIHDADGTNGNDYSFLSPTQGSTVVGAGCNDCGKTVAATSLPTITANSGLISANRADLSYVNLADMNTYTDAVGDSNLLNSTQGWFATVKGANANNEQGAEIAYETRGNGLAVYNGFDTDMIMPTASSPWRCVNSPQTQYLCPSGAAHEQVDWVAQMWYNELNQSWGPSAGGGGSNPGTGLPKTTPVSSIGTPVPPSQAGLPSAKACVAKRSLFLRLKNLIRHKKGIVQIDVYVNGRHRLREKGHWRNVTLRRLPKKGAVTIKIVATTKRHYHLISKQRYHAC
jgi:hypothetical protein